MGGEQGDAQANIRKPICFSPFGLGVGTDTNITDDADIFKVNYTAEFDHRQ